MKCLNAAMRAPGILVVLACLTVSFSVIKGFTQEQPQKLIGHAMLARVLAANGKTDEALKAYCQFYELSEILSEELLLEVVRGILNHDDRGWVRWYAAQVLSEVRDNRGSPCLGERT